MSTDERQQLCCQHDIDVMMSQAAVGSDVPIAITGGTATHPLVVRRRTAVPVVVLSGSYVELRGQAWATVIGAGSVIVARHHSRVKARGINHVVACDQSKVEICHDSSVEARNRATVRLFHYARAIVRNQSICRCHGNSTVDVYDNARCTLFDVAEATRRSRSAHISVSRGTPHIDEYALCAPVVLNKFDPEAAKRENQERGCTD